MESSDEADKIKYWQYKLSQKQKTQTSKETNKSKINKPKTPEKKKKMPATPILQDNFFTSTIDKLKHLLQDSVVRKPQEPVSAHAKRSKDVTATKSSIKGVTQPLRKLKQGDSIRLTKSISLANGPKLSKRLNEEQKNKLLKTSPKKSKSRSKSKKYKTDKSKDHIKTHQLKISPQKKPSKKKHKEKVPKKKVDGIQLTAFDEQDPIWSKVQMDTMVIHEKSDFQEYFPSDTTNFKIWQEQQQKQYVKKLENGAVIQRYLHSFINFSLFQRQKERKSLRNSREALNLSQMIKNQEQKLLQLKDYLRRLKNTDNLNESLEVIITKVNQNIKGLKHMEQINRVKNESLKDLMVNEQQHIEDSKEVQFDKQSEYSQQQVEDQYSSKDYLSPRNPIKVQRENILMVDSLCLSNYEQSHKKQERQSSFSKYIDQQIQNLKEQSSLLLINSKFNDNSFLNYSTLNTKATDKTNEKNTIYIEEQDHKSSLLLSAESKSEIRLLSPDFKVTDQVKDKSQLSSYIPKFQCEGGKKDKFQEVKNITKEISYFKQQITSSAEKQLINNNKTLNDSLSKIISNSIKIEEQSAIKIEVQKKQINLQLRNQLLEYIFQDLLGQITQFFGSHQQGLERLFSHYNGEIVDVYEGEPLEGVNDVFSQNGGPIQSSDAYLIELAMKVLEVAKDSGLREKLKKPLGVTTLITLRYMRHLDENAEEDMEDQLQDLDSYAEILDHQDFEMFEAKCSSDPQHAEQLILNRCLYDALNVILDQLRPYGSRGRPAFCFGQKPHDAPSLNKIKKFVEMQLKKLIDIRMGIIGNDKIPQQQLNSQMNQSLMRYNLNLVQQIERQYGEQTDDGLQTYQLMLVIEQQVIENEIWELANLQKRRNQLLRTSFH